MKFKETHLVSIYLKNGQVITDWFDSMKARKDRNVLESLEWKFTKKDQQMLYLSLTDVSAIVKHKTKTRFAFKG